MHDNMNNSHNKMLNKKNKLQKIFKNNFFTREVKNMKKTIILYKKMHMRQKYKTSIGTRNTNSAQWLHLEVRKGYNWKWTGWGASSDLIIFTL